METTQASFDYSKWENLMGENKKTALRVGFDKDHIIENVMLDGRKVTEQHVTMNDFVKDIRFE